MTATTYPVDLQIERPEKNSPGWAIMTIFGIKFFALIINIIVLYIFSIAVGVIFFISQFIVLFTGKYPQGMHTFMVKVMHWNMQISAFMFGLRDDFPPFAPNDDPSAVSLVVPYPDKSSRGWAIMTIFPIKALALIPQIIALFFVMLAMAVVWYSSQPVVLFTGKFPEGMHGFIVGVMRWMTRVNAFYYGLCDQYPPFGLS
jgi:Domain of unknown function (DUF4389)